VPLLSDGCHALVLNADYRPLSYFPLSLWSWQEAVKAVVMNRVDVVSVYDQAIHSSRLTMRIPSVISLREYVRTARHPAFTRFNVFLRDRFSCQYCGRRMPTHDLTFDHVTPRSRGGRTTWENVVTACAVCNMTKGSRSCRESRMFPRVQPRRPSSYELQDAGRVFPPNYLHESWRDYLYWDSELEAW
jgi:5-methylcytosine-specific restriction endonuclease McrA